MILSSLKQFMQKSTLKIVKIIVFFLVIILISDYSFANTDTVNYFRWQCAKEKCALYVRLNNGKEILVSHDWKYDIAYKSTPIKYSINLMAMFTGCGNNCHYTTFVDLDSGKVSDAYYGVLAVNPTKLVIALPDPDDVSDNTIDVIPIFNLNAKPIKIKRDFAQGADVSVDAVFDKNGNLNIEYESGDNQWVCKENIFIEYDEL